MAKMGKWLERARRLSIPQSCDNSANSIGRVVTTGPIVTIGAIVTGSEVVSWDAEDWRAYYGERAGIAEHDGGLTRAEAEASALQHCIVKWLALNPPADTGEHSCCHCREYAGPDALVILAGNGTMHRVIHSRCHAPLLVERRTEALAAINVALFQPEEQKQ
jgi:hypothetical protein